MKKSDFFLLAFVFLLALFLRFYQLSDFAAYHQDQVRDLLFIKDHFDKEQFILLGPKASVGNFFLPPFWYYLMSVAYFFSNSPVAPAYLVGFFSAAAAPLIYLFSHKFYGQKVAIFSSLLYGVSPLSIEYSRFAWNPNPIPFFTILTFLFLFLYLFKKKEVAFYGGVIASNLVLQLHYQGLVIFLFFFLALALYKKLTLKKFLVAILLNLILILPFIIYEFQNNFQNTSGILSFAVHSQTNQNLRFFGIPFFIKFLGTDFLVFLGRSLFFSNTVLGGIALVLMAASYFPFKQREEKTDLLKLFFIFAFLMLFIYKNSLIAFYLIFLLPILPVYFVISFYRLVKPEKIVTLSLSVLILINLVTSPAFGRTDDVFRNTKAAVDSISSPNQYCVVYEIPAETFIELKFRYLFSISQNPPQSKNCQELYYICQEPLCNLQAHNYISTGSKVVPNPSVIIYKVRTRN